MATQCKLEIPAVQGLKDSELTVGREFLLVCDGLFPRTLKTENLKFQLPPENQYQIHLLGFEFRSPTQADLKVTTYSTGSIDIKNLILTDGEENLDLGQVGFEVSSVLPPPNPAAGTEAKPPEPFGPLGPSAVSVPTVYWASLLVILGLLVTRISLQLLKKAQRKKMLEDLRQYDAALSPLSQLHQNYRRLQRSNTVFFGGQASSDDVQQCIDETNKYFRLFITRQFQMPALQWNEKLILKDLKKYHPKAYEKYAQDLGAVLGEIGKAQKEIAKATQNDALQLSKRSRYLAEKMEALK